LRMPVLPQKMALPKVRNGRKQKWRGKLCLWRVDLDESARRSGWEIGDRGGLSMPVLFVAGKD